MEGPTKEERLVRLVPGILAMFACAGLAALDGAAYYRHLDTGDQAGFALGTLFLVNWFLPVAATLLLVGAIWAAPPEARPEGRLARGITMAALIAGAVFFLAHGLWMGLLLQGSRLSRSEMLARWGYPAVIAAFAINVLACAFAARRRGATLSPRGRVWLAGVFLAIAAIVIYEIAGLASEAELKQYVLIVAGPGLVWIGTLLWSARRLRRERPVTHVERSGG